MKEVISSIVAVLMLFIVINIVPVISATDHSFSALTSVSYTPPTTYTLTPHLEGCRAEYNVVAPGTPPDGGGRFDPLEEPVSGLPSTFDLFVRFTYIENNNKQIVLVTATIGGIPVGTYGTEILTIPANITGDVTITSSIKSLPDGVSMGEYNKYTNTPEGAGPTILDAFNYYKYLTFDGVAGRWIIIGAHGLLSGNNVGDPKNELGLGQVLLLSENCILNDDGTTVMIRVYDNEAHNEANWSNSDIRAYLNGISISENTGTSVYAENGGFYQNSGLKEKYGGSIVGQNLTTAWYDGTKVTINKTGTDGVEPADKIFLLATDARMEESLNEHEHQLFNDQHYCIETYLGNETNNIIIEGCWWWLRSGNDTVAHAHSVCNDGVIYTHRIAAEDVVRPAFVFQMPTATLSFDVGTGNSADNPQPISVAYNAPIGALPTPTREGYTFTGWKINEGTENISIDSTTTYIWPENKTAVAQWTVITYNITYHNMENGGTGGELICTNFEDAPSTYTIESETISLGTPTMISCTFHGWYTDYDLTQPIEEIPHGSTGDKELYAKWEYTCCVVGETPITMFDRSTRRADEIKVGDKALTYNFETKNLEEDTVLDVVVKFRTMTVTLDFEDKTSLILTNDHPLFSKRGWVCYDPQAGRTTYKTVNIEDIAIHKDDLIFSLNELFDKKIVDITTQDYSDNPIVVYTFSMAKNHNFFANECLVHNGGSEWEPGPVCGYQQPWQ